MKEPISYYQTKTPGTYGPTYARPAPVKRETKYEDIQDAVLKFIKQEFLLARDENLNINTRMRTDLDADSLKAVELAMAIERDFDVFIDDATIDATLDNNCSIKTIIDLICDKKGIKKPTNPQPLPVLQKLREETSNKR